MGRGEGRKKVGLEVDCSDLSVFFPLNSKVESVLNNLMSLSPPIQTHSQASSACGGTAKVAPASPAIMDRKSKATHADTMKADPFSWMQIYYTSCRLVLLERILYFQLVPGEEDPD